MYNLILLPYKYSSTHFLQFIVVFVLIQFVNSYSPIFLYFFEYSLQFFSLFSFPRHLFEVGHNFSFVKLFIFKLFNIVFVHSKHNFLNEKYLFFIL